MIVTLCVVGILRPNPNRCVMYMRQVEVSKENCLALVRAHAKKNTLYIDYMSINGKDLVLHGLGNLPSIEGKEHMGVDGWL